MLEQTSDFTVQATYKVSEAEGVLDRYFYRKLGFRLAQFFARFNASPTQVTLLGGLFGVVAGHLYYYRDIRINIVGMALHILANALDNADGQLARMTGKTSREGRIFDSFIDHVVFASIYTHLAFRILHGGGSPAVFLVGFAAGISHALQGVAADYFRIGFLYFTNGRAKAPLDSSEDLKADYRALEWRREPWKKFMLALCINFTRQQEMLVPLLNRLRAAVDQRFPGEIPNWFRARYRECARPLFKWWGFFMTNTRMLILFFLLLINQPVWFFWIELTAMNILLAWLLIRQTSMFRSLLEMTVTAPDPAPAAG